MTRFVRRLLAMAFAIVCMFLFGLGVAVARHEWFFTCELADGVKIVQSPFEHSHDIHTRRGLVIDHVFGWIVRPSRIYGSYGQSSYFMIDLADCEVTEFNGLTELNRILLAEGFPRYDMSDEENISHLKGGHRKYH